MRKVGIVCENEDGLRLAVEKLKASQLGDVSFINANALENETALDVLMAQDANPALGKALNMLNEGAYVIINSDKKEIFPFLSGRRGAFRLITYGFNNKACVTASSTMNGTLQACVQRGFVSLNGQMLEPQEIDFPYETDADAALGLAAVCLACGVI